MGGAAEGSLTTLSEVECVKSNQPEEGFLSAGVTADSLQTTSEPRTSVFISNKLFLLLSQCKSLSINNWPDAGTTVEALELQRACAL